MTQCREEQEMRTTDAKAHDRKNRRGVALVLALVCLLVVAAIGTAIVQTLARERQQMQRQQLQTQTTWVAESAIQRAAGQLSMDAEYAGETWSIDAEAVGGQWPAEAVIRIEPVESDETVRRVLVTARYPKRPQFGIVQEREIEIKLPTTGESS